MMIDRLEQRLQFATVSGLIYADADNSKTFDANESARAGTTVFIDANANGAFDSGETSTTADKTGRYAFTGLAAGDYTIGTTTDNAKFNSTNVGKNGTKKGRFDINIVGLENASPSVRAAFEDAKQRWESVLTGDMPDVRLNNGKTVDDLRITAAIGPIDGFLNILGYSSPTAIRSGSNIPYLAEMRFDSVDLAYLQSNNQLSDVILHEMGHALGFGTIWKANSLITGLNSRSPRFIGENAVREYNKLFKTNNLSVPVANTGGSGTRESHWNEGVLREELMTGIEETPPQLVPLSRITVGQFQDEGYDVNYAAADKWKPSTREVTKTVPTDFGAVANERQLTVASTDRVTDMDFGYAAITAPVIRAFTINPSPVAQGTNIVLSAAGISDADGDTLSGVTFWRESNGIPGLQSTGDTAIGQRTFTKNKAYTIETSTDGLVGDQVFYATATDSGGRTGRRTGVVNVASTTIPTNIPSNLAVRQRTSNVVRFSFVDTNTDAIGYRIEVGTRSDFASASLVYTFNISPDITGSTIGGLRAGLTYYIRVRAFNLAGATPYSSSVVFETV